MAGLLLRGGLLASLVANLLFVLMVYVLVAQRDAALAERDVLATQVIHQRAEFEARARQREREQHEALAAIRLIFAREMQDAQDQHDAVVAGLRADAGRLRSHWQGCVATADLSAAAAAAAGADGGAELRARGAAALVRAGGQCDAQIRALQSFARTCAGGQP